MSIQFYTKSEYVGKANITSYYAVFEKAFFLIRTNDRVPDQIETNFCPGGINTEKMDPIRMESFMSLLLRYFMKSAIELDLMLVFDEQGFANKMRETHYNDRRIPSDIDGIIAITSELVAKSLVFVTRHELRDNFFGEAEAPKNPEMEGEDLS